MWFRQNKALLSKISLLLLMITLLVVVGGLTGLGCIKGLQALGWSGGAIADDTLFVGSKEGRLVAINLADGSRQWSEPLKTSGSAGLFGCDATSMYGGGCGGGSTGVAIYGTPAIGDGLIYIAGYNGKVYAYDSSSLNRIWDYPDDDYIQPIVGGPTVSQDTVYIGAADNNKLWKLYALDAATGNERWSFETGEKIWSTPTVSGDTVFFGSFDKKLYALDTATGAEKWAQPFETEGAIATTPIVINGMVYFGSFDRHFYAVDAVTGQQVWRFPVTDEAENIPKNWFWATPVAYGDAIYAPCLDGKVYVLNAATGDEVADAIDLGSPISSSPVIVDSTIVLASQEGAIYALDTSSGQLRILIDDIEEEVYGPLSASGGVVYIHTQDLNIHAVDIITGALKTFSLERGE